MNPPPSLKRPAPIPMDGDKPAWYTTLKRNGYPTDVLVLDFEAFFDAEYSLKKTSQIEYITDDRWEEIGHATIHMQTPFGPVEPKFWFADEGVNYVKSLVRDHGSDLKGLTVVAHNLSFDALVLAKRYGVFPKYMIDTLGLARHESARSKNDLATLAKRWNLRSKGDTSQFKGLHLADMTPEQRVAMSDYACGDAEIEWGLFCRLLPRLSRPDVELRLMAHTIRLATRPLLCVNQEFATELAGKMDHEVDKVLAAVGHTKEEISGSKSFGVLLGAALDEAGDKAAKYMKPGKLGPILAIAKTDEQLQTLIAHPSDRVRALIAARSAIKSWPNHIKRVKNISAQAAANGNILPISLNYHAAHTSRWGGSGGINPQNLPSRNPNNVINSIRHLLVAPPDHVLAVADAAQIEARILSWIAGQEDLNEAWRQNRDVYSEFASKVTGRAVRKKRDTDPPPLGRWYGRMRDMGKVGVLGCLAAGTPVLTSRGWKAVESVKADDLVWDGESWVNHDGVIYQGERECVNLNGILLTPDHGVLTSDGWTTALGASCLSPLSGKCGESLLSPPLNTDPEAGLSVSNAVAPAVKSLLQTGRISEKVRLPGALNALVQLLVGKSLSITSFLTPTAKDWLLESVHVLSDAIAALMPDTDCEGCLYTLIGSPIAQRLHDIFSRCPVGITPIWKSTGSTMIAATSRAIYDSQPAQSKCETLAFIGGMCRLRYALSAENPLNRHSLGDSGKLIAARRVAGARAVYDILRAGPNRRFQAGPFMVANCGYGMGAEKCQSFAETTYHLDMPITEAINLVQTYRRENPQITKFWRTIEQRFKAAAKYHEASEMDRGLKFHYEADHDLTVVTLPSGHRLHYKGVRVSLISGQEKVWLPDPMKGGNSREFTWGGSLCENVVQAMARQILGNGILATEDKGYRVALHAHDEIVAVVPKEKGEQAVKDICKILSTPPAWAGDCPLGAEGFTSEKYTK